MNYIILSLLFIIMPISAYGVMPSYLESSLFHNGRFDTWDYFENQDVIEITYGFSNMPTNNNILLNATERAINSWEEANPRLKFIEIDSITTGITPHITIMWWQEINNHYNARGLANCMDFGIHMIDFPDSPLYSTDSGHERLNKCFLYATYNQSVSEDQITDTLMHEIGHALGLAHSTNSDHLMHSRILPYDTDIAPFVAPESPMKEHKRGLVAEFKQ